jgi:hypothetical protein
LRKYQRKIKPEHAFLPDSSSEVFMDGVALNSNTRAALNAGEGQQGVAISALKAAAASEKAIVALLENSAINLQAVAPAGQGANVDKVA